MNDRPQPTINQTYMNNPNDKLPVDKRHLSVEIISDDYLPVEGELEEATYDATAQDEYADQTYNDTVVDTHLEENVYAGIQWGGNECWHHIYIALTQ